MELRLSDGRVARWFFIRRGPIASHFPFQVSDSTCTDAVGLVCNYQGHAGANIAFWIWTKHPDSKMVNQQIKFKSKTPPGGNSVPLFDFNIFTPVDKKHAPKIVGDMLNDSIECKDFSWLPSGKPEAPEKVRILRWDAEMMQVNPETGECRIGLSALLLILR